MWTRLKSWIVGAGLAVGGLFGYQVAKPPVIEQAPVTATASPSPGPVVETIPTPSPTPQGTPSAWPELQLGKVTGATASETQMIQKGFEMAKQVYASQCFKDAILNGKFTETNGLTNEQIYNVFMTKKVSVGIEMFSGSFKENYLTKTMAYEGNGTAVRFNRHFIDTPEEVGSTYLHEISHNLGFKHYGTFSSSIPYQLNAIFTKCLKKD